jgi:hypothetical protein
LQELLEMTWRDTFSVSVAHSECAQLTWQLNVHCGFAAVLH